MNLDFSPEDVAFREEARSFIAENYPQILRDKATRNEDLTKEDYLSWHRILAKKGWAVPSWPKEFGGCDWTPTQKYIWSEEQARADTIGILPFGVSMLAPVVYTFGTPEQKAKFLPDIRDGLIWWCQGYSEPGSGSDLASLKTKAERVTGDDGKEYYIVNGQKTWTTLGQHADWGFFLVRTDPDAKPQAGISFLLIDMKTPGITVRPLILLDEGHEVNEVFFDDVHVLRGSESAHTLSRLLVAAPDYVRFVVCGREGMDFDLAVLTARGLVRWVTQRELKLDAQDVQELVRRRRLSAGDEEVDHIVGITEGWPALVQLALASGEGVQEADEGSSNLLMDSFIYESFFKGLAPARQQALFVMAAVGDFTLPLLVALNAPEGAEAIAEGEQLGIVQRRGRVAGEPFYALHALVAERALMRLVGVGGVLARILRTRCAQWWHARGEVYRAIRTALEGDDARLASTYLTSYAHQLVQGEGRHETFLDLLAQLESRSVEPDCALMLQAVWALVFLRRYAEAAAWLARIERACGKGKSAGVRLILHTTVLQRGVIAGLRDDEADAEVFVRQWLAGPPDPDPFHYGAAQTVLAYAHKCNGRFAEATQSLREAQVKFEEAPSPYGLMWVRVISAASLLKAGRHRDALADSASALSGAPAFTPGAAGLAAMLRAIRALLLYERNQCTEAMVEVEAALPLLPHQGIVDAMIAGYVAASRLQAARGDISGALDAAAEGERVGLARGFVRLQLTMVAERALLLLRAGDVEAARRMASDHGLLPQGPQTNLHRDKAERLWARLDLAQGEEALHRRLAGIWASRADRYSELRQAQARMESIPKQVGTWEAEDQTLDEDQVRIGDIGAHLVRTYTDRGTGQKLAVLIVAGVVVINLFSKSVPH